MSEPEPMLLVSEVAQRLRIDVTTVYRLIAAGQLPALRISKNTYRVPESAYDAYYAQCMQAATTA